VKIRRITKTAVGAAVVLGTLAAGIGVAGADYQPSATDVVGVSGVTPQVPFNFGADGDILGDTGYNAANNPNKLVNFDATGDANGRNAYLGNSSSALNPTAVYQAGTSPIQRPASTGLAYTALISDTGTVHKLDYLGAATPPTAAQQSAAVAAAHVGSLHVVQLGTDGVNIVAANTTNVPATLDITDLLAIYKNGVTSWSALPHHPSAAAGTIKPYIPGTTSAIYKALYADLKAENGSDFTLAPTVVTSEQNDPTPVAGDPNALEPFSTARLNVWNNNGGYFKNPNTAFPGGSIVLSGVKAVSGWTSQNGIYAVFRESDVSSTTPWQPGSTKNWVKTLFLDPSGTPFFKSPAGLALLAAGGITPGYVDRGNGYAVG
jgi:hypothetical protein